MIIKCVHCECQVYFREATNYRYARWLHTNNRLRWCDDQMNVATPDL